MGEYAFSLTGNAQSCQRVAQLVKVILEMVEELEEEMEEEPEEEVEPECPICLDPMENFPRRTRMTPYTLLCGHGFHVQCIKRVCERRAACPLCRARITDIPSVMVVEGKLKVGLFNHRTPFSHGR